MRMKYGVLVGFAIAVQAFAAQDVLINDGTAICFYSSANHPVLAAVWDNSTGCTGGLKSDWPPQCNNAISGCGDPVSYTQATQNTCLLSQQIQAAYCRNGCCNYTFFSLDANRITDGSTGTPNSCHIFQDAMVGAD